MASNNEGQALFVVDSHNSVKQIFTFVNNTNMCEH